MSDVEGGLRAALREDRPCAGVDARYFLDVAGTATLPYVTLGLADAQEDTSDAPLDRTLVQIDAWGATKGQAHASYMSLRAWLAGLQCGRTLTAGTTFRGVRIVPGTTYLPDADGTPRYIISAEVIVGP